MNKILKCFCFWVSFNLCNQFHFSFPGFLFYWLYPFFFMFCFSGISFFTGFFLLYVFFCIFMFYLYFAVLKFLFYFFRNFRRFLRFLFFSYFGFLAPIWFYFIHFFKVKCTPTIVDVQIKQLQFITTMPTVNADSTTPQNNCSTCSKPSDVIQIKFDLHSFETAVNENAKHRKKWRTQERNNFSLPKKATTPAKHADMQMPKWREQQKKSGVGWKPMSEKQINKKKKKKKKLDSFHFRLDPFCRWWFCRNEDLLIGIFRGGRCSELLLPD